MNTTNSPNIPDIESMRKKSEESKWENTRKVIEYLGKVVDYEAAAGRSYFFLSWQSLTTDYNNFFVSEIVAAFEKAGYTINAGKNDIVISW